MIRQPTFRERLLASASHIPAAAAREMFRKDAVQVGREFLRKFGTPEPKIRSLSDGQLIEVVAVGAAVETGARDVYASKPVARLLGLKLR